MPEAGGGVGALNAVVSESDRRLLSSTAPGRTLESGGQKAPDNRKELTMRQRIRATGLAICAVLAFGLVSCSDDDTDTSISDEVQELMDEYTQAWNDNDGDAFLSLVTDDFRMVSSATETNAAQQASIIEQRWNWTVEEVGEGVMTGDGPYYVAVVDRLESETAETLNGVSTVTVVDDGGMLKVSEHVYTGDL